MTDNNIKKLNDAIVNKMDDEKVLAFIHQEQRRIEKELEETEKEIRILPSEREVINDDGKVMGVERYADEADIIQAIKTSEPDKIDNEIYFFPQGNYLFITDKGYPYSLPFIDRISTTEQVEIHKIRYEMMVVFRDATSDEQVLAYNEYKQVQEGKIAAIYKAASSRAYYKVKPLKKGKQIRIYTSSYYVEKIKALGYNVIEQERSKKSALWHAGTNTYRVSENKDLSYSFVMGTNAFISACKYGKIPHKGYTITADGNEVASKSTGIKEAITLLVGGEEKHYSSKSEAAKDLGISASLISKRIKADSADIMSITKGSKNNSKGLALITEDGSILEFSSVRDAARKFGIDKSKMSRIVKGKSSGDILRIDGGIFTIK